MIIVLGLLILVVAAVMAVAGIFGNTGSTHAVNGAFSVFGHHMTGSTGTLFLFGIIVGAAAMLGLGLLLTGARRTSRRGLNARRDLRQSRRETVAADKDREILAGQRDTARARTAAVAQERDDLAEQRDDLIDQRELDQRKRVPSGSSGTRAIAASDGAPAPSGGGTRGLHLFGYHLTRR
ncbi:hypothetical protein [Streptacidiphilus rugosus]|uniref:hypothetical protein n=1 Tax=Streptacidiphilus rugosus TaxID=405783 RepID=UPI0007C7CD27|nr:hypothetical protein [Streptacidiphilus rugosus]